MARVLTWNVAGRVKDSLERQIAALAEQPADVVCLQEVTPTSLHRWSAALSDRGLHVAVSPWVAEPLGSRRLAVCIASRAPVVPVAVDGLPWPERHLAVRTAVEGVEVEVHTVHAPLSGKPDQVKVRTLEAVYAAVTSAGDVPRIVTGDLNTPAYESREGEISTFARTRSGRLRAEYGERHDRAELLLVGELPRTHGWSDAFRALHGYGARDRSWVMAHGKFGWRLDHILLSPQLEPVGCQYVHGWREQKLSDHSAMWADVRPRPEAG